MLCNSNHRPLTRVGHYAISPITSNRTSTLIIKEQSVDLDSKPLQHLQCTLLNPSQSSKACLRIAAMLHPGEPSKCPLMSLLFALCIGKSHCSKSFVFPFNYIIIILIHSFLHSVCSRHCTNYCFSKVRYFS